MRERRVLSKGAVVLGLLLQMMLVCPASLAEMWWDSDQFAGYYQGCGEGCEFSPDGKSILVFGNEGAVILNPENAKEMISVSIGTVRCAHFGPEGQRVVAVQNGVHIWQLRGTKAVGDLLPQSADAMDACFSHDGMHVAAVFDNFLCVWEANSRKLLFKAESKDVLRKVVFSPDDRTLLALDADDHHPMRLWDAVNGRLLHVLPNGSNWEKTRSAVFQPNGKLLAAGTTINFPDRESKVVVRFWDPRTGTPQYEWPFPESPQEIFCLAFSPDGKRIAVGALGFQVLESDTGKPLTKSLGGPAGHWPVLHVEFAKIGDRVVGVGSGYIATVWDLRAQRSVLNAGNREQIDEASISPDGLRVVTLTHWKSEAFTWKLPRG